MAFGAICLPGEAVAAIATATAGVITALYARMNKITDIQIERLQRFDDEARRAALEEARHGRKE